ncbi:MAG: transcriptional regulator [Candidatus Thorarchaeota archaeon]|nr:MAG: transcriptional regulator [Candidatus Thorarchaeota archaeon]
MTNRLRELREAKMNESETPELWTQEGLAKRLGVTRQTIISMEKGTYNPSLALAFKLAHLFEMKIEDIFELRGEKNES